MAFPSCLTGNLTDEELVTPIKDLSLFKVGWYLFGQQPFKMFIGISQIVASLLLLYRKTMVIGVIMLIPIVLNILIIDLTIMHLGFKIAFTFRLTFYLIFLLLLLRYYRKDLLPAWNRISNIKAIKVPHPRRAYFFIPVIMVLLECLSGIAQYLFLIIINPKWVWEGIKSLF